MAQGLGYALSAGAGGMSDALRQVEQDKLAKQELQNRAELARQALLRQMAGDAERTRQFDLNYRSFSDARAAQAERDRAAAAKDANRQQGLQSLATNPAAFDAMTPLQKLLTLSQYGVGNVGMKDLESPDVVASRAQAAKESAFADWKRRQDYAEQQQRSRPDMTETRAQGRLRLDDPALPRGVQDYLVSLRAKHPTYDAAVGEFNTSLGSLRAAHPSLSSTKAIDSLRRQFTGGGTTGDDELDALVNDALGGDSAPVTGGGRGAGPAPARLRMAGPMGGNQPAGPKGTVSLAELQAIAQRRGTSVEAEQQRATAAGFLVR